MKRYSIPLMVVFGINALIYANLQDERSIETLRKQLGDHVWSAPEKRLIRATIYKIGPGAGDGNSKSKQGNEKVHLHYASHKEVGNVAAPYWLPRGSVVKIHTQQGDSFFMAVDVGQTVDKGMAAKKLGKNKGQKQAPVLDFCARRQLWPDFVNVELFYYSGRVPFEKLSREQQEALLVYAGKYFIEKKR